MNPYTFYHSNVRPPGEVFIGSSDIPIIIKLPRTTIKKSQRDLWLEKRGEVPQWKGNDSTDTGHELEPINIAKWIKKNYDPETAFQFKLDAIKHQNERPKDYLPPTDFLPYTECVHPQFFWAKAHADCINPLEEIGIEAKTGGYFARVRREGYDGFDIDEKSELEDPDKIPIEVMLQVQWQMMIYGLSRWVVLLWVDNQQYVYEIPAFTNWWPIMIEKASRFYNCCITGEVPPPENKKDVFGMIDNLKDKAVYVVGDRALIAEDMKKRKKHLKNMSKKIDKEVKDIEDAAVLLMGENLALFNGETGRKLFSQSKYTSTPPISPSALDEEDQKKYRELGVIKDTEIRRVY